MARRLPRTAEYPSSSQDVSRVDRQVAPILRVIDGELEGL